MDWRRVWRRRRARRGQEARSPVPAEIELLEYRELLSATAAPAETPVQPAVEVAHPDLQQTTPSASGSPVSPILPSEMRAAYGVSLITFGTVAGTGAGQTIAVIEAFHDPNIISDANTFSATYGLPSFNGSGQPSLRVLNETGGTTLATATNTTWSLEESLDVEWAHVIAPQANIVVVEANSGNFPDLFTAAKTAASLPGVSVVSMSFSGGETLTESSTDTFFTTPSGHAGVTFLASTGDSGSAGAYPADSPNVVAVGGTVLGTDSSGDYLSETAWSSGGGGISQDESQPGYQAGKVNGTSSTARTIPDVSMDAGTSVEILDSFDGGWSSVGGTSVACPMWAGLVSIVDQGRALKGLPSLDGPSQTLPMLYNLPSSDFHDITSGSNGFAATTGYDLATGLGTPIANLLVPDMVARSPLVSGPASATVSMNGSLKFSTANGNALSVSDGFAGNSTEQLSLSVSSGSLTLASGSGVTVSGGANGSPSMTIKGTLAQVDNALNGLVYTPNANYSGADSLVLTYVDTVGGGTLTGSATIDLTVSVSTNQAPTITSTNNATFAVGSTGSFSVTASGSPSPAFSESGGLPTGLSFNSTTGVLSGTPGTGTGGTYAITFTASNGVGTPASQTFTLTVDQAPAITSTNKATFTVGTAGTFSVSASGFPVPTLTETGTLPSGLSFNSSTGVLSGTPASGTGGSYTLTFTVANGIGAQASQTFTLTINQSPVISSANNATFTVGSAGSFTVKAGGFPASTLTETGTLPGGLLFNSSTGVLSGTPTAGTAGTYTLTFSAANGVGLTATQSFTLQVNGSAASALAFLQMPSTATAGQVLNPTIQIALEDSHGNVVTSNNSTVTLTLNGGVFAGGASTLTAQAVNGIATFTNAVINKAGTYSLSGSDGSLAGVAPGSITVNPAAASKLAFLQTPGTSTAGQALGPAIQVAVEDQFGNIVTQNTSTVGIAVLTGPRTFFAAGSTDGMVTTNGVAVFSNLILKLAGTYTLAIGDGSLTGATSSSITVLPAAAYKLTLLQVPTTGTVGIALSPALQVAVQDQLGNVVTTDTSVVTLTLSSGTFVGGGTTVTARAVNGIVTFNNLILATAGAFTLSASDGSLVGTVTGSIWCGAS